MSVQKIFQNPCCLVINYIRPGFFLPSLRSVPCRGGACCAASLAARWLSLAVVSGDSSLRYTGSSLFLLMQSPGSGSQAQELWPMA